MVFRTRNRNRQFTGNLFIRQAMTDIQKNLPLAWR